MKHSVAVFKKHGTLVGYIPTDISQLIDYFMKENKENFLSALFVGSRKRKVWLVVTAKFAAVTKELRVATVLLAEILKIKTKYTYFELWFAESKIVKQPMLKLLNVF